MGFHNLLDSHFPRLFLGALEDSGDGNMSRLFGKKLSNHRQRKKLSLGKLADRVGSSKTYIWQLENKKNANPTGKLLFSIARILDVSAEYLIDDSQPLAPDKSLICNSCDGDGGFDDTTYDRTGAWCTCGKCYGTGWSEEKIRDVVLQAKQQEVARYEDAYFSSCQMKGETNG